MGHDRSPDVEAFIKLVGRSRFEEALGLPTQVITRAIKANVMPAHWYFGARDLGDSLDVEVPEHLFRQTHKRPRPSNKQSANQPVDRRGVRQPVQSDMSVTASETVRSAGEAAR